MTLAAELQPILDLLNSAGPIDYDTLEPEALRAQFKMLSVSDGATEVGDVRDMAVPGPAGDIPVRTYRPAGLGEEPAPVLAWFHGGGWVIGDLDTADGAARRLCAQAGCVVVSVDYRLAPEHPAPAGFEDCWAVTTWLAEHAAEVGGDPTRLAVGGDSAGGNLAALVALRAVAEGGPALRFQLLVYPATDLRMEHDSITRNGEGYFLTHGTMLWFRSHYLPEGTDAASPAVSPLLAADEDLARVAPAHVITAEYDPLVDEGDAYAEKLRSLGVDVSHDRRDGMIHGFFGMGTITPVATEATEVAAQRLRAALA